MHESLWIVDVYFSHDKIDGFVLMAKHFEKKKKKFNWQNLCALFKYFYKLQFLSIYFEIN